jgi:hypothetical protein
VTLVLSSVGALTARVREARAESQPSCALSWVELPGAEACGGAPAMARAVEDRLGRHAIVSPAEADLSIEARVERSQHPTLWHAVLRLRTADGRTLGVRELNSAAEDCDELRSAVAIAAALMIDPHAAMRSKSQPPSPPPVAPAPSSTSTPPPPGEVAPAPAAPAAQPPPAIASPPQIVVQGTEAPGPTLGSSGRVPWRVEPSASFALGFGVLPSVSTGARIGVAVTPPSLWTLEAFGVAWSDQTVPAGSGAQVRLSVTEAGLGICPIRIGGDRRASLTVCGGVEVAVFESVSQGFETPKTSVDPSVRVVLPARLTFPVLRAVAVRVGGDLGLALTRDQFVYEDSANQKQLLSGSPEVVAEADIGVSAMLP